MQSTLVCVLLALSNAKLIASAGGMQMISSRRLAVTHILFEITAVVDLLGISVYWT